MGNEELNTIPEKESDEFIKFSVEDLIPIPRESEDTFGSDSESVLPSSDDFSLVFEEKSVTFSNPLFEFNNEYISNDLSPLFDEVLEDIECKDSYDSNLDEPALLVTPLFDANKDECLDLGGVIDEIDAFLDMDISTDIKNGYWYRIFRHNQGCGLTGLGNKAFLARAGSLPDCFCSSFLKMVSKGGVVGVGWWGVGFWGVGEVVVGVSRVADVEGGLEGERVVVERDRGRAVLRRGWEVGSESSIESECLLEVGVRGWGVRGGVVVVWVGGVEGELDVADGGWHRVGGWRWAN
ncbi:hypothetical protein Tco_0311685 [Tanacetum coccineum]